MNDILSQAEIDELLQSLSTGEDENALSGQEEAVKRYDFRTANRFTKEQIRAINIVFKNFVHLLSNYFMGTLRADCEAEVLSIEEMSFNEFNNSVPSPVIIGIVNSTPFTGPIILEMTKEISYSIINRVLGGTKEVLSENRQFTEIELAIMERVLWQILKHLDEAWMKMIEVCSDLEKIETSMQFAQIVDMNEPVLMVTLNISIGNESGLMGVCLPHQALEPFMKSLSTKMMYCGKANNTVNAQSDKIKASLVNTQIVLTSIFNPTPATVKDIMSLREGDVILLKHKVDEPLTVKYQQIPKYRASMGKYRNNLAVKLLDVFRGEEDGQFIPSRN
ncbi:MAG: flagellar motor switch protein FliM [Clostridia bacterium]|nr:flagellar motor switch protein FliM [Clostridia bacterium]